MPTILYHLVHICIYKCSCRTACVQILNRCKCHFSSKYLSNVQYFHGKGSSILTLHCNYSKTEKWLEHENHRWPMQCINIIWINVTANTTVENHHHWDSCGFVSSPHTRRYWYFDLCKQFHMSLHVGRTMKSKTKSHHSHDKMFQLLE